jgi:hypothetical protein
MKKIYKLILINLFLMCALLALPTRVFAQTPGGDESPVVFGDNFTLKSGETIKDLVVFGGNATIQQDALVTGDIILFGGDLNISGKVGGDITAFGGNVSLGESANVVGDINTIGGNRNIAPGAKYGGLYTNPSRLPFRMPSLLVTPDLSVDMGPSFSILGAVFLALFLAILAVIVTLFLPRQTEMVARTITAEPIISGGIGLLTLVVAPAIFLVLAITIILALPAILFLLVFGIAMLFGWIALGLELGKRLAGLVHSYWPVPVSAGVGTLLLSLVSNLILALTGSWLFALCCVGLPVIILLTILGLGAVVASRFGTQALAERHPIPFPPAPPSQPAEPETPASPPAAP